MHRIFKVKCTICESISTDFEALSHSLMKILIWRTKPIKWTALHARCSHIDVAKGCEMSGKYTTVVYIYIRECSLIDVYIAQQIQLILPYVPIEWICDREKAKEEWSEWASERAKCERWCIHVRCETVMVPRYLHSIFSGRMLELVPTIASSSSMENIWITTNTCAVLPATQRKQ